MTIFKSTQNLNNTMLDLWTAIKQDESMSQPLLESRLIVTFHYRSPDFKLTINCGDGQNFHILPNDNSLKPDIELFMKADIAHEFWLGKVNIAMALLSGKVVSKGPINKALALLPVIKPAYGLYPDIFKKNNE